MKSEEIKQECGNKPPTKKTVILSTLDYTIIEWPPCVQHNSISGPHFEVWNQDMAWRGNNINNIERFKAINYTKNFASFVLWVYVNPIRIQSLFQNSMIVIPSSRKSVSFEAQKNIDDRLTFLICSSHR